MLYIYNPYIPGALICENVGLLKNEKAHLHIKNKKGSIKPDEIAFTGRDCIMYPQLRPVYCAVQLQISRGERRNDCRVWAASHEGSPGQVGVQDPRRREKLYSGLINLIFGHLYHLDSSLEAEGDDG